MELKDYFEQAKGKGIIATADANGKVGMAVYGRPHFLSEKRVAFIMADRLMHKNLMSNPRASYLFIEDGPRYKGKRLYMTKIREEQDNELAEQLRRKKRYLSDESYKKGERFVVYFKIDKVLPLIGTVEKPE